MNKTTKDLISHANWLLTDYISSYIEERKLSVPDNLVGWTVITNTIRSHLEVAIDAATKPVASFDKDKFLWRYSKNLTHLKTTGIDFGLEYQVDFADGATSGMLTLTGTVVKPEKPDEKTHLEFHYTIDYKIQQCKVKVEVVQ